jgi:Flp pilus assembly protein TadD
MAENNLSVVLTERRQFADAKTHAEQALRLRPNYRDAHLSLGNIALAQNRAEEAIPQFQAALTIEPRLPKAHNNLGNALRLKGDFRGAISEYEQTIKLDPHSVSARNNLAWILAACADTSLRNGARAVELARVADALSQGSNIIVLHTLAAAYAQNRQFTDAVAIARRGLRLAVAQNNVQLVNALQREIELYQSGSAYHQEALQNSK